MKRILRTVAFNRNHGFTLVELLVSMAVFLVVITIAAQTFNTVITSASKYSKMEESNIEGIIGLELLRHDLEQMGFGLFWGFVSGSTVSYTESTVANASTNDAPNGVPRAFVARNNTESFSSDFFGVKATTVGNTKPSQRWTYASFNNYSSSSGFESRPIMWPSNNLQTSPADKVIAVRTNFNDASDDHLLLDNAGSFIFDYNNTGGINTAFLPTKDQQISMIYGIESSSVTPRMPFNRSDYFIGTGNLGGSTVPPFCAPSTGVLYKATVNHANGQYRYTPLLDCVADMQVVLGWDASEEGKANTVSGYSDASGSNASGVATSDVQTWLADPKGLREHLKLIKVYILAQEGKIDPGYTYQSASIVVGDPANGETSLSSTYAFSAAQRSYHWKLYRLIVRPKNLLSNQR